MTGPSSGPKPQLSVVLPCRNGAATLPVQLEALARQKWDEPWELVVSDNGSTDESLAMIESYRDRLPSLRIVDSSDRAGTPHALNAGVAAAAADSVAFVNDDDEVADGWVAAMGGALAKHDLVAGRLDVDKLNEPWAVSVRGRPQTEGLVEWGFAEYLPFAFGPTIGVRRSLHEAIGGFDEAMMPAAEDMDYCWRLQLHGASFHLVPEAMTHYRFRHSLRALFRQGLAYGYGHVRVYKKYRPLGLPRQRRALRRGVRAWAGLVKLLLGVRNRATLGLLLWHAGLRLGLARGSLRYRVVFL